jgi:hypothetical protein
MKEIITMAVIENFAALSAQEQRTFAEALIKTINSESIFSSEVNFEITAVEAEEMSGGLWIEASNADPVDVAREASWQAADEDEASYDPGYDADYTGTIFDDIKSSFKTMEATIEGYRVSLDITDVDEDETIEVEVDRISHEDSGIGHYEYWGDVGYDSHPYVEVEGTIIKACTCQLAFFVEPAITPIDTEHEEA